MTWIDFHNLLLFIQHAISVTGVLIIFFGILVALGQFIFYVLTGRVFSNGAIVNNIRLNLGRILILGLEFIVAADLIGTTTTPDYYSLGILAIIVVIRTLLSFTINREIMMLSNEQQSSIDLSKSPKDAGISP